MRWYHRILCISYKDIVTNKEVCAKFKQATGPQEDLLAIIQRHKLQWYGHGSHSSGLVKTILQGTVKGRRRQGRQKKRWEDNIGEWTGLEFAKSQRAVENKEKWRKLVVKSSVVPQRPSELRDRWGGEVRSGIVSSKGKLFYCYCTPTQQRRSYKDDGTMKEILPATGKRLVHYSSHKIPYTKRRRRGMNQREITYQDRIPGSRRSMQSYIVTRPWLRR